MFCFLHSEPPVPNTSKSPYARGSGILLSHKSPWQLGLCSSPEQALQTYSEPHAPLVSIRAPSSAQASHECSLSSFVLAGHSELAAAMETGRALLSTWHQAQDCDPTTCDLGTLPGHSCVLGPTQTLLSDLTNTGAFN